MEPISSGHPTTSASNQTQTPKNKTVDQKAQQAAQILKNQGYQSDITRAIVAGGDGRYYQAIQTKKPRTNTEKTAVAARAAASAVLTFGHSVVHQAGDIKTSWNPAKKTYYTPLGPEHEAEITKAHTVVFKDEKGVETSCDVRKQSETTNYAKTVYNNDRGHFTEIPNVGIVMVQNDHLGQILHIPYENGQPDFSKATFQLLSNAKTGEIYNGEDLVRAAKAFIITYPTIKDNLSKMMSTKIDAKTTDEAFNKQSIDWMTQLAKLQNPGAISNELKTKLADLKTKKDEIIENLKSDETPESKKTSNLELEKLSKEGKNLNKHLKAAQKENSRIKSEISKLPSNVREIFNQEGDTEAQLRALIATTLVDDKNTTIGNWDKGLRLAAEQKNGRIGALKIDLELAQKTGDANKISRAKLALENAQDEARSLVDSLYCSYTISDERIPLPNPNALPRSNHSLKIASGKLQSSEQREQLLATLKTKLLDFPDEDSNDKTRLNRQIKNCELEIKALKSYESSVETIKNPSSTHQEIANAQLEAGVALDKLFHTHIDNTDGTVSPSSVDATRPIDHRRLRMSAALEKNTPNTVVIHLGGDPIVRVGKNTMKLNEKKGVYESTINFFKSGGGWSGISISDGDKKRLISLYSKEAPGRRLANPAKGGAPDSTSTGPNLSDEER